MLGAATRGDVLLQVVRDGGVEAAIGASVLSELLQWRQWFPPHGVGGVVASHVVGVAPPHCLCFTADAVHLGAVGAVTTVLLETVTAVRHGKPVAAPRDV